DTKKGQRQKANCGLAQRTAREHREVSVVLCDSPRATAVLHDWLQKSHALTHVALVFLAGYAVAAMASVMALPRSAGLSATVMPAARRAFILSSAVPLPPLMMAPAWPMRLPGGAVRPAMNAATGLCMFSATHWAAFSSALPP